MSVPPLHPINNFNSYISGDVKIHPTAAIAPGVLFQASPNSQIVIGAGVCIGMGSILQAHEGILEVEAGATLGAGVLVIGKVKIGANACIGSTTTILNQSLEPGQVVAAGSLIGDTSRQIAQNTTATAQGDTTEPEEATSAIVPTPAESSLDQSQSDSSDNSSNQVVYGQKNVKQLLSTLFPHRQSFKQLQDGK